MTARRLKDLESRNISFLPLTQPLEIDLQDDEEYVNEMKSQGGRDPED